MVVETRCARVETKFRHVRFCMFCLQIRVFVRVRPLNGREDPCTDSLRETDLCPRVGLSCGKIQQILICWFHQDFAHMRDGIYVDAESGTAQPPEQKKHVRHLAGKARFACFAACFESSRGIQAQEQEYAKCTTSSALLAAPGTAECCSVSCS